MKKLKLVHLALLALMTLNLSGQDSKFHLSKEKIIENAWSAMFGELTSDEVKSISVEVRDKEMTLTNKILVKRPNLYRNINDDSTLIFDGRRVVEIKNIANKGVNPNAEILSSNHWAHFEVDIALIFPAIFDHPSKFHGLREIEGKMVYEFFVALPLGGNVNYFIDAVNFKIIKRIARWEGNLAHREFVTMIAKHKTYDNIIYPEGFSYLSRDGKEKHVFYEKININPIHNNEIFNLGNYLKD